MAHPRTLIRQAIVARLKSDLGDLGERIYSNRFVPISQMKLPCVLVYTIKETSVVSNESPREYKRDLQVSIEICAKANESLDDVLDDLCLKVEKSIFKEETFDGLVSDTLLSDTELAVLTDGDKPIGTAQITLTLPYYAYLPDEPEFELDDLNTINTKIDMGSDDVIDSEDQINVSGS